MSKISMYLAVSLVIISIVLGIGIGYFFTPQYSLSKFDKNEMNLGPADKWIDLRYINAMISHHRAAILLAEQGELSNRIEILNLSKEIQKNEPVLINELYALKKNMYKDTKKVSDPQISKLGSYNETFDLRFLNALISHHENGIMMTEDVMTKSSNNEILDNANIVRNFLMDTSITLKELRTSWYNI